MSRQNKVNPGMYTQRGRLTQDDAARELRKQSSIGSQHTWQPVKKNALPRLSPVADGDSGTETSEDNESNDETSPAAETRQVSRVTKKKTATKSAPMKANAKAAKKTVKATTVKARTSKAKKTTGKAKTGRAAKTAAKRTAGKPKRKAVLARNVGGGGATPRPTRKRRKS